MLWSPKSHKADIVSDATVDRPFAVPLSNVFYSSKKKERWLELYSYWISKCCKNNPPSRKDIDPVVDIPNLARELVLLDVEGRDFRYRVAGSQVEARFSKRLGGRLIGLEDTPSHVLAQWRSALSVAASNQQPGLYDLQLPAELKVRYVVLILPLVDLRLCTEKLLVGSFCDGYLTPGTPILGMSPIKNISPSGSLEAASGVVRAPCRQGNINEAMKGPAMASNQFPAFR
jgi:hypothetical protein